MADKKEVVKVKGVKKGNLFIPDPVPRKIVPVKRVDALSMLSKLNGAAILTPSEYTSLQKRVHKNVIDPVKAKK